MFERKNVGSSPVGIEIRSLKAALGASETPPWSQTFLLLLANAVPERRGSASVVVPRSPGGRKPTSSQFSKRSLGWVLAHVGKCFVRSILVSARNLSLFPSPPSFSHPITILHFMIWFS